MTDPEEARYYAGLTTPTDPELPSSIEDCRWLLDRIYYVGRCNALATPEMNERLDAIQQRIGKADVRQTEQARKPLIYNDETLERLQERAAKVASAEEDRLAARYAACARMRYSRSPYLVELLRDRTEADQNEADSLFADEVLAAIQRLMREGRLCGSVIDPRDGK